MSMLASSPVFIAADWPYRVFWLLAPITLSVEALIMWRRHSESLRFKKVLGLIVLANGVSSLGGEAWSRLNPTVSLYKPLGDLEAEAAFAVLGVWVLASLVEYGVIRAVTTLAAFKFALTSVLMNLGSCLLVLGVGEFSLKGMKNWVG